MSDDVIYRQAASYALNTIKVSKNETWYSFYQKVLDVFSKLPSAEPERKKGRWIEDADTYYKAVNEKGGGVNDNTPYFTDDIACSECLAMFSVLDNCTENFDFCPHCGAYMRGDENG